MPRIQISICSGVCLFISSIATAQSILKKNSSVQQVISYHVYQQKLWELKQLPKNSVLYQYNNMHVLKTYLPSNENSDLHGINISFKALNPETKSNPHLSISERMQLNLQKTSYRYDYMEFVPCVGPMPKKIAYNKKFPNHSEFSLPLTKFDQ